MEKRIVVVGGGIAGLSAAQTAAASDKEAAVFLICGEKRLPYYRPRICEVFSGLDIEKLNVHNEQWFIDNRIELIYQTVQEINAQEKQLRFIGEEQSFNYDKLIIATGAVGNRPAAEGTDADNVLALRFLADIDRVRRYPGPVVVVGGGLLGLEAAWHLSCEGRQVVIIERGERLLPRQLDEEASRFFLHIVENAGIRVALNGSLEAIRNGQVILSDSRGYPAAVTIFAAGIKPQIALAQAAGLQCNRAIIVDEMMATSAADIFACGDCAEFNGSVPGLWTVSMAQGMVAGKNAVGVRESYIPEEPPYMMNAMGTSIWSGGNITLQESFTRSFPAEGKFSKLFFNDDGQLAGAILIGETGKSVTLKKAIANGMNKAEALTLI
mgnify:CR=1 FL=1